MSLATKEFPQYIGTDSKLLVGGTVSYYEADAGGVLTTPKTVYRDAEQSDPYPSNTLILNSLGTTDDAVYIPKPYGIIVKDADGGTVKVVGWVDA